MNRQEADDRWRLLSRVVQAPVGLLYIKLNGLYRSRPMVTIESYDDDGRCVALRSWIADPEEDDDDRSTLEQHLVELGQLNPADAKALAEEILDSWLPSLPTGTFIPDRRVNTFIVAVLLLIALAVTGVVLVILC